MPHSIARRSLLAASGAGLLAAALPPGAHATGRKLKIALSNSYIGNKWRIEMENVFKAALQMEPFKSPGRGLAGSTPATTSAGSRSRSPT